MKELCFNLWYWLDKRQHIIAIAAKGYVLDGSDDTKAAVLAKLSNLEYSNIPAFALPKSIYYTELKRRGVESVFAPEFDRIRKNCPEDLPFPNEKLFYATPLYDFGQGH